VKSLLLRKSPEDAKNVRVSRDVSYSAKICASSQRAAALAGLKPRAQERVPSDSAQQIHDPVGV
jgi:hypothetical protein